MKNMNQFILAASLLTSSLGDTTSAKTDSSYNVKTGKSSEMVNISNQPLWAPTGYRYVEYYYLPDIETFYSVTNHQYIYFSNHRWNFTALPLKYRAVDLYNCYKVIINEPKPFLRFQEYKDAYATFKGSKQKRPITKNTEDERFKPSFINQSNKVRAWEECVEKKQGRT